MGHLTTRADNHWFDEKYRRGERPTLRDRAALFTQLDIRLSDRTKRKLEDELKEKLQDLKRNYCPSTHILAYELLFCFAPFLGLDDKDYLDYIDRYNQALKRHQGEVVFDCNFDPDETRTPQP
ncbi:hypothetical protein CMI37_34085 [Candidatus Pacearchaeota archaeon]|nr:hypothetical protein [Candidatus Pacearchaeota archaeon]|tara:strand:- start:139 stop:507 length:369 start_codon:yes stop_codon:yes gene_type:complete